MYACVRVIVMHDRQEQDSRVQHPHGTIHETARVDPLYRMVLEALQHRLVVQSERVVLSEPERLALLEPMRSPLIMGNKNHVGAVWSHFHLALGISVWRHTRALRVAPTDLYVIERGRDWGI